MDMKYSRKARSLEVPSPLHVSDMFLYYFPWVGVEEAEMLGQTQKHMIWIHAREIPRCGKSNQKQAWAASYHDRVATQLMKRLW